jgi:hypothetical protein
MFVAVLVGLIVLIGGAVALDVNARRHHHRNRGSGDIAAEIREQHRYARTREATWFKDSGTISGTRPQYRDPDRRS